MVDLYIMNTADKQDIAKGIRLLELRNIFNENQTEFAKRLGIQQGNYSKIEKGSRAIGKRLSKDIIDTLKLNARWFNEGEGDIFKSGCDPRIENIEQEPGESENQPIQTGITERDLEFRLLEEKVKYLERENEFLRGLLKNEK